MTDPDVGIDRLSGARALAHLLDDSIRIPVVGVRFGLDPVIGLIPGLGDFAVAILSGYVVVLGARLGAPRSVIIRMIGNVAVDTIGGSIPLLGDVFDVLIAIKPMVRTFPVPLSCTSTPEIFSSSFWCAFT